MSAPYKFGFPSRIKGISFPGKPRIITVEVAGTTPNTGNYSYNGEGFIFYAARPVGPNNLIGGIALVPGTAGPLGLPTFSGAGAPAILNPISTDMINRLYSWQRPVPGYISADGTKGGAVLFLDIDNASKIFNNPLNFLFGIQTSSHGSSTPPPQPAYSYFMYWTSLATVSGTSFMDTSGNYGGNDPTNPYQMQIYGQELFSGNSMNFELGLSVGPGVPSTVYPTLFGSQGELNAWIAYLAGGPSPPYPSGQGPGLNYPWKTPAPRQISAGVGGFAWLEPPVPPAGSAACSWTITVTSWRLANSFAVNPNGTLGVVKLINPNPNNRSATPGKTIPVNRVWAPVMRQTVTSRGSDSHACANVVTVQGMTFTIAQRFS